jgi:hypothetical protein
VRRVDNITKDDVQNLAAPNLAELEWLKTTRTAEGAAMTDNTLSPLSDVIDGTAERLGPGGMRE